MSWTIDDSWTINYSAKTNCLLIDTNDYHANPLQLSADQLRQMLKMLESADKPIQLPDDAEAHDANDQKSPFFGISRKDKCLYIGIPDGWSGLLEISRKDLYRFGKKMGKRARAARNN